MMRVDSHMHAWRASGGPTPGVETLVPPQVDVPILQARSAMAAAGIDRAVLVQPVFRGEDNRDVADWARAEPERFAAVCVVDPRRPDAAGRLEHWVWHGCRGLRLRPSLAEEEAVFGDAATFPLWEMAERAGVVVSLLCRAAHLPAVGCLAQRFAKARIVIDHLGHPELAAGVGAIGFHELLALARATNVYVKLSGFYHFCAEAPPYPTCQPFVRTLVEHFGPRRLLWGSDFPHCTVKCGYENSLRVVLEALGDVSHEERDAITGGTALSLYWPER
jgi:L-fuconolactonase